jgi:hypothetical protein
MRLMGSVPVGRIVYTRQALPAVELVNFGLIDGDIIIRTSAEGKLAAATRGVVVAFEADSVDLAGQTGWSVAIVGQARAVTDGAEIRRLEVMTPPSRVAWGNDHLISISPAIVNGRRVRPPSLATAPGCRTEISLPVWRRKDVVLMRALVIYESMYGDTRAVATGIAAGLGAGHEVTLVPVTRATPELVATAGLIVAGAPTHRHGMPTLASRRLAVEAARKAGSGLTMDPMPTDRACAPGLRRLTRKVCSPRPSTPGSAGCPC